MKLQLHFVVESFAGRKFRELTNKSTFYRFSIILLNNWIYKIIEHPIDTVETLLCSKIPITSQKSAIRNFAKINEIELLILPFKHTHKLSAIYLET